MGIPSPFDTASLPAFRNAHRSSNLKVYARQPTPLLPLTRPVMLSKRDKLKGMGLTELQACAMHCKLPCFSDH